VCDYGCTINRIREILERRAKSGGKNKLPILSLSMSASSLMILLIVGEKARQGNIHGMSSQNDNTTTFCSLNNLPNLMP
jgi:hypothetical protein